MTKAKPKKDPLRFPLHVFQGNQEEQMKQLYDNWYSCTRCPLHESRPGPDICFASGNPNARIMLVGEGPGEEEERTSVPFYGASGKLLDQMIADTSDDLGIKELWLWFNRGRRTKAMEEHFYTKMREYRDQEFFITNVVACRPPVESQHGNSMNRPPTKVEAEACWERLYNMIHIVDPWIILTFGKTAAEIIRKKPVNITNERGKICEVYLPGRVGMVQKATIALLHPAYLLRVADWGQQDGFYAKTREDLVMALKMRDRLNNLYFGTPLPIRGGG